jgi:hypothetical protein
MIKPSVDVVRKNVSPKVEIVAGKIKSVTLPLPLVNEKGTSLVIYLPEPALRDLIKQAKEVPKSLRVQFIKEWLMQNQMAAFHQYVKSKKKKFAYENITVTPPRYQFAIPEKIPQLPGTGKRTNPFVIQILASHSNKLTKIGRTRINLPLVVDLGKSGLLYFVVKLKLEQLADASVSTTSTEIIAVLKKQITNWAMANDINTGTTDFTSALHSAIGNIAPSIREQVKRMKVKHPEWSKI